MYPPPRNFKIKSHQKVKFLSGFLTKFHERAHFSDLVEMSTRNSMLRSKLKIGSRLPGDVLPPSFP